MHAAPEKSPPTFATHGFVRLWAFALRMLAAVALAFGAAGAGAQLQRSIINPGFEMPFVGPHAAQFNAAYLGSTSWGMFDQSEVPGWETSAPPVTICPATSTGGVPAYTCNPIELWFNGHTGILPVDGRALAELNAVESAKLYQNICLVDGESFDFEFAHRGRLGYDSARFETGAGPIMSVTTGNTGTVGVIDATVATAVSAVPAPNGWTRYSGHYVHTGPGGLQQLGFVAVSAAGGPSQGNLLDDVKISLKPYVELVTTTFSVEGNPMAQVPKLRVVGVVTSPMNVALLLSGSATPGSDYDFGGPSPLAVAATSPTGLTLTVPPGNYGAEAGNTLLDLPLRILDDALAEPIEPVGVALLPAGPGAAYVVANGITCGGAARTVLAHGIVDNDVDLASSAAVSSPSTPPGGTVAFTLTFADATPPLGAPNTQVSVNGTLQAAAPPGMTFTSWTCTAAAPAACPAAAGSGDIAAAAFLGRGGTLTYVVEAVAAATPSSCGEWLTVTASVTAGTGTAQVSTSALSGALSEASGVQGSPSFTMASNTGTAATRVSACTNLSIAKDNGVETVAAGGTTVYQLTVFNAGPGDASNAVLRDIPVEGLACQSVSCAGVSGAASCPAAGVTLGNLQGPGIVLDNFPANSSIRFELTCGVSATGV